MNRPACRTFVSALVLTLRWINWGIRWAVIWPLATMVLFIAFVLWKDGTTPGQLMAREIEQVRMATAAGQFPVNICRESDLFTTTPPVLAEDCPVTLTDAAGYAAERNRTLLQLGKAVWATLALLYVSLAVMTGVVPVKMAPYVYGRSALYYRQADGSTGKIIDADPVSDKNKPEK
ncbi:conjugal transfer protein TraP [Salmonella enterica]|nr:conjugal transfer protein TraP [Salmonella enterica]EKB7612328.1 conjugal transfer protein TraP [Salmonella enterica]